LLSSKNHRNIQLDKETDVQSVVEQEVICESLDFAGFVLESLLTEEIYQELKKLVGKKGFIV